ncbi:MFS transporter [Microbispora sp. ZYX-F-249]|uniref:MFS transporter n=1 Tax=Microbispora maris TaxID=3144104 RepID=A0ABV0B4Z3_9ACTN
MTAYRPYPFWGAQVVSWTGSSLQSAVLPLWLYQLTGSTRLALGGFVTDCLIRALVSPVVGALVRTRTPFRVLLLGDAIAFLATAALAATVRDASLVAAVYPLTAVTALAMQANQLALQALVPRLVEQGRLAAVNGAMQTCLSAIAMVAPPLAGVLGALVDWRYLILLNAVSFLVSLLLSYWALSQPATPPPADGRTAAEHPLRTVVRHWREFRSGGAAEFVCAESLLFLCFGASQALFYGAIIEAGPREGGVSFGLLLLGSGAGSVCGGLALRKLGPAPRLVIVVAGVLSLAGPALVVTGLHTVIAVAAVGTAMVGASGNLLIGGVTTAVQQREDAERLAVTLGLRRGLSSLAQLGCYLWTIGVAAVTGFQAVYLTAGAAACLVALFYYRSASRTGRVAATLEEAL